MDKTLIIPIKKFRKALEKQGIPVKKMILYGSHAKGRADKGSDIDIVVISDYFQGMSVLQRGETFGKIFAGARIVAPIEPMGFTEAEFNNKRSGTFIGDEVKTKGIEVN